MINLCIFFLFEPQLFDFKSIHYTIMDRGLIIQLFLILWPGAVKLDGHNWPLTNWRLWFWCFLCITLYMHRMNSTTTKKSAKSTKIVFLETNFYGLCCFLNTFLFFGSLCTKKLSHTIHFWILTSKSLNSTIVGSNLVYLLYQNVGLS